MGRVVSIGELHSGKIISLLGLLSRFCLWLNRGFRFKPCLMRRCKSLNGGQVVLAILMIMVNKYYRGLNCYKKSAS